MQLISSVQTTWTAQLITVRMGCQLSQNIPGNTNLLHGSSMTHMTHIKLNWQKEEETLKYTPCEWGSRTHWRLSYKQWFLTLSFLGGFCHLQTPTAKLFVVCLYVREETSQRIQFSTLQPALLHRRWCRLRHQREDRLGSRRLHPCWFTPTTSEIVQRFYAFGSGKETYIVIPWGHSSSHSN